MNKVMITLALVLSFCVNTALWSTAGRDINTVTKNNVCTAVATNSECTMGSLNAVGDLVNIDISGIGISQLGRITSDQTFLIGLPTAGSKAVYAFKPSIGELANRLVHVVFVSYTLNMVGVPGFSQRDRDDALRLLPAVQTIVKAFRKLEGEQLWTELGSSYRGRPITELGNVEVTLKPNGTAIVQQGDGRAPMTIPSLGHFIVKPSWGT